MAKKKTATKKPLELSEGLVRVSFSGKSYDLDLLEIKLLCEEAEQKSPPKIKDEMYCPTPEFLRELAKQLGTVIAGCTPTAAWQIWVQISSKMDELKKNLQF